MRIRETPFAQLATEAKRRTPWWLAYIVVIWGCILALQIGITALLGALLPVPAGTPLAQLQAALGFAAALLGIVAWVLLYERRGIRSLGLRGRGGAVRLLIGFVAGIGLFALPLGVLVLSGNYRASDAVASSDGSGMSTIVLLAGLALLVLVQAGSEEVLLRGYLLQNSALTLPGWIAVLLPAVVFTVLHFTFDPLPFAGILLYALFATFVVLQQGSLWLIVGIHTGWNVAQATIFGIPVSGHPATASLLAFEPVDGAPTWLTGGEFGVEASAASVPVLAIAAVIAFLLFRRPTRTATV